MPRRRSIDGVIADQLDFGWVCHREWLADLCGTNAGDSADHFGSKEWIRSNVQSVQRSMKTE